MKKILLLTFFFCSMVMIHCGHVHMHTNREREEDGAFVARDHSHFENNEHNHDFDHEAILGSVKEAEEFDTLSPEEAKKRLRVLLQKMDLNGDKQIEHQELHAWIIRSFKSLSEEESGERFDDTDTDSDNVITWREYLVEAYSVDDDDPQQLKVLDDTDGKMIAEDRIMFDAADRNKDGKLTREEFAMFTHPEEYPVMLPLILEQTLKEKDANGDGYIDFQEFIGDRGVEHDKEWLLVEKEKFDTDYDKNKDGLLDKAEILAWIVPSNDEIAAEEVEHLFATSDDDQNGFLSFDEVLNHHDVFVGSEATDFGDQLHDVSHDEL